MTIKALVYGGVQITGIVPPAAASQYDGIWFEMRGSTMRADGTWCPAGLTVEMSAKDAIDFILALYLAVEKHADDTSKMPASLVKRLQKRLEKKAKATGEAV